MLGSHVIAEEEWCAQEDQEDGEQEEEKGVRWEAESIEERNDSVRPLL
jgi:hypothetical protein